MNILLHLPLTRIRSSATSAPPTPTPGRDLRVASTTASAARNARRLPRHRSLGTLATTCGEHLRKGSLIGVAGRLDRDEWQAKDGTPRDRVFVVATSIDFLSARTARRRAGSGLTES